MTLANLEEALRGSTLDDILQAGFIDQGHAPPQFRALRTAVYLEFSSTTVEFQAVDSTGTMAIACVQSVQASAELDDDMLPATASRRDDVLDDSAGSNEVTSLRLWGVVEEHGLIRCGAAQIELANGQVVFLDPTYHFGIRVGGEAQKALWLRNWPGANDLEEFVLSLSVR